MTYCKEETTVEGEEVWCELPEGHDGKHAARVPQEDVPGLKWPWHKWGGA